MDTKNISFDSINYYRDGAMHKIDYTHFPLIDELGVCMDNNYRIFFQDITKENLQQLKTYFPDFYAKLVVVLAEKLL
jgi:hypothetical protein